MIIIGFCHKTSKILPHIFCRKFRHCAPITVSASGEMMLYQFVRRGHITRIKLRMRDIKILQTAGWRFVYLPIDATPDFTRNAWTCVDMTKRAIGCHRPLIQTPDALYIQLTNAK